MPSFERAVLERSRELSPWSPSKRASAWAPFAPSSLPASLVWLQIDSLERELFESCEKGVARQGAQSRRAQIVRLEVEAAQVVKGGGPGESLEHGADDVVVDPFEMEPSQGCSREGRITQIEQALCEDLDLLDKAPSKLRPGRGNPVFGL